MIRLRVYGLKSIALTGNWDYTPHSGLGSVSPPRHFLEGMSMLNGSCRWAWLMLIGLSWCALATETAEGQVFNIPTSSSRFTNFVALDAIQAAQMDMNIFLVNTQDPNGTPLQSPSGSVSKLDLKSPWKARREYDKGYQLLLKKDLQGAVEHLLRSTAIYPSYVAAHNALGTAYLNLNQTEQARDEFGKAVELDEHMPNSYLNLGCAHLALKQYPEAEEAFRKASSIAPLDLQLRVALAYGEFVNHDYSAVLDTAREVHGKKHTGAAMVHFFAAGAWEAQNNLPETQKEMETLLREDPKSGSAEQFRQILEQVKAEQASQAEAKQHPAQPVRFSFDTSAPPTVEEAARYARQVLQNVKERSQIAEAEAEPEATCADCGRTMPVESAIASNSSAGIKQPGTNFAGTTFRAAVDEVSILFAATEHGKSVTDLTASDIEVRDDSRPPADIMGFRNESQLPLRLGLILDTSNSVTNRFEFEHAAAIKFLQKVVTHNDDLAFVIGVNNSVLLVQDFTSDQTLTARAVNQLAPSGGTALWDAVAFAADKLASHHEEQPVARILVVISDGEDNSSSTTLKQAIASSLQADTAVYTVSTRESDDLDETALLGDHALKTLSELTGGAAFNGSLRSLNGNLANLQQVIRGRYLVSYKPASFQRDGHYRTIDVTAHKDGHKLKVYARKGYYASDRQLSLEGR